MDERYECEHFTFSAVYYPSKKTVMQALVFHYRHADMSIEDYRGMLKAMLRLDEQIGTNG